MLMNGFILGAITFAAWATVFHKLPPKVKAWCAKYSLVTDAFFTFVTYLILSDALIALMAAAWVGLMFEGYMFILRNREDLDWLFDGLDRVKDSFESIKQSMIKKNEVYKASKVIQAVPA